MPTRLTRSQIIDQIATNGAGGISGQTLQNALGGMVLFYGPYAAGTYYFADEVTSGGSLYRCQVDSTTTAPPGSDWLTVGAASSTPTPTPTQTPTPTSTPTATVLTFSDRGTGGHLAYPANYGSNAAATPDVTVSYSSNALIDNPWNSAMPYGMFANPTATVSITFTPAAGYAVTLQSFTAGLYQGDSAGQYTFALLNVTDANGNVLWDPAEPYPTLTSAAATTISPNATGAAGVAITLNFKDTAADGEVGICAITFAQSTAT